MAIVCVDTHVLIWAVKQECTPGQEHMMERAKHLIKSCQDAKDRIVVPAVVIGEILCGTPVERHERLFRAIQESAFIIAPYDLNATRINAKIWQERNPGWKEMIAPDSVSRQAIKTDILILATAVAHRCSLLYTEDRPLFNLAKPYINCHLISEVTLPPRQIDLLDE